MVMEKSWNMKDWAKVMEFCDQSWNFTNFASLILPNLYFLVITKKLSSNLETPHFLTFSTKCRECKFGKRDAHGKSRIGHGGVMEKYFIKSVGTLAYGFRGVFYKQHFCC